MRQSFIVLVALVALSSVTSANTPPHSLPHVPAISVTAAPSSGTNSTLRTLTLVERIDAQRAIERVFWAHRIWPTGNPGPKPPLEVVMPDTVIRTKVEDYLKKSNALDELWRRPVTAAQLQAEMERLVSRTKDPIVLKELFTALGNDSFLIAETLARPILVDRLCRHWYSLDARFHDAPKRAATDALSAFVDPESMASTSGEYSEHTWLLEIPSALPSPPDSDNFATRLGPEEWETHTAQLRKLFTFAQETLPARVPSKIREDADAFYMTVVLEADPTRIRTATLSWRKVPFDTWWEATRSSLSTDVYAETSVYGPPHSNDDSCIDDTWSGVGSHAPSERSDHYAVWTGSEMIVWGPDNSGDRYSPEPPRVFRRPRSLRGWGHGKAKPVFTRGQGPGGPAGPGA